MACGSCQAMGQNCLFWIAERAVLPAGKGRFGSPNGLSCNSLGVNRLARAGWAAVFNINMLMANPRSPARQGAGRGLLCKPRGS